MCHASIVLPMVVAAQWADPGHSVWTAQVFFHWSIVAVAALVFLFASLLALQLLTVILSPGVTDRGSDRVRTVPIRSLIVGLAVMALMAALLGAVEKHSRLGIAVYPVAVMLILTGLVSITQEVGRWVMDLAGRSGSRFRLLVVGWAVVCVASAFPVVGWIVGGLLLLPLGIGGYLLALVSRSGKPKAAGDVATAVVVADPPAGGTV